MNAVAPVEPDTREVGIDDVDNLVARLREAHDKLGKKNSNRALLREAGWMLHMLCKRVVALQYAEAMRRAEQSESRIVRPY